MTEASKDAPYVPDTVPIRRQVRPLLVDRTTCATFAHSANANYSMISINLDSLIGTETPVGGRLLLASTSGPDGRMLKTRCLGVPTRKCGVVSLVKARDLRKGKALWCAGCQWEQKRIAATHTPVGAEFVAARKRHAKRSA